MASLKELKGRIGSVKSTQKITKAKQMVAAAKLRKAQAAAEAARPYAGRLEAVIASLSSKVTISSSSPRLLAGTGSDQTHLLVVCNSDPRFPAPFNSTIFSSALLLSALLHPPVKSFLFFLLFLTVRPLFLLFFPLLTLSLFFFFFCFFFFFLFF